ncbi:MAG: HlyD family efflux transporter periplasmic adaptor subunit [Candidatus Absconditabacterales bacterium]|nr:HlyD family efflux transporter periplasmic adaptor subunit [Candidatus Absconditabacterales bacterium]
MFYIGMFFVLVLSSIFLSGCSSSPSGESSTLTSFTGEQGSLTVSFDESFADGTGTVSLSGGLVTGSMLPQIDGKDPYFISVRSVGTFPRSASLAKNGQIKSARVFDIVAQVRGRVRTIFFREGQNVNTNTIIMSLDDDGANFGLQLERADLGRKNALLQYEQLAKNLEKQEADLKRTLTQAQENFQIVTEQTQQQVKLALENLTNVRAQGTGSQASLTLARTEALIGNQLLTVQDILTTQSEQFFSFLETVLFDVDFLFDVQGRNQSRIQSYDSFLGAKDPIGKTQVKRDWYIMDRLRTTLSGSLQGRNEEQILQRLDDLKNAYNLLDRYITQVTNVIRASVEAQSFPRTQITTLINQYIGYNTQRRQLNQSLLAAESQIRNLLTPVGSGSLAQQDLEIQKTQFAFQERQAEIAYENSLIAQKDALFKAQTAVKAAQDALDTFLATKEIQLSLARNAIDQANIAYRELQDQVARLQVRSTINGRIDAILVSEGQNISPGTPLARVVDTNHIDVVVGVASRELQYLRPGQIVTINQTSSGTIQTIAPQANRNLQHEVTIRANPGLSLSLGQFARVEFPIQTSGILLPLQFVTITKPNLGFVSLRSGNRITQQFVTLGNVRNNAVEVTSGLALTDSIVTSQLSQFSPLLFYPVVR